MEIEKGEIMYEYSSYLMPCGCGGCGVYFPVEDDMGFVECDRCDMRTPSMFPESAAEIWNTAMGGERVREEIEFLVCYGVTQDEVSEEIAYRNKTGDDTGDDYLETFTTSELLAIETMWDWYYPSVMKEKT